MKPKTIWRLNPYISQNAASGKRKGCWLLVKVTQSAGGESTVPMGAYDTVAEAKKMVQHLKRKPIELH